MLFALTLAGALLTGYVLLVLAGARLMIRPFRLFPFASPGFHGAPQQDVSIRTDDGLQLNAWWVDAGEAPTVLLLHGYTMNRGEHAPTAAWLREHGFSSLSLDFRAHGRSSDARCTIGWDERMDVIAAARWVRSKRPDQPIAALGASMGAVAALFACAEEPDLLDALVLDGPYANLGQAGVGWWGMLGGGIWYVLAPIVPLGSILIGRNPWRVSTVDSLRRCQPKPILLMHGERDPLTPSASQKLLSDAAGENASIVTFDGCGHTQGRFFRSDQYYTAILRFLQQNLKGADDAAHARDTVSQHSATGEQSPKPES